MYVGDLHLLNFIHHRDKPGGIFTFPNPSAAQNAFHHCSITPLFHSEQRIDMTGSGDWQKRALQVIPGGVNSPVRAFGAVGGTPVFMRAGNGARLETVEGASLLDYCCSWGPLLFGHAYPPVVEAVQRAAADGTSFGAATPGEVRFAEELCACVPGMDKVRLVNSGTEAVMTALRVARGATGRNRVLKFEGCYHGHSDALLVAAGSGLLTGGIGSSAGVPPGAVADMLVAPYNDVAAVETIVAACGDELAAVIVEPVAGNMGLVPPAPGFLERLRALTARHGIVLIFDEVISGFRLGPTTYGATAGITPDLVCLGKIIGGGLPLGACGGHAELLDHLAPDGPVYQAGTLSGNPLAVAAGLATLAAIRRDPPYDRLAALGRRLADGLARLAAEADTPLAVAQLGGMLTPFFRAGLPNDLVGAKQSDTAAYARYFHAMLDRGLYLPPSQFEVAFLSAAHTEADVDRTLEAAAQALAPLQVKSPIPPALRRW